MSSLVLMDKFAPSQTPYAFIPKSFRNYMDYLSVVTAIWAGRKNGRTTVSYGTLTASRVDSFDEFVEKIDMRYGGAYEAKWDGETLITGGAVTTYRHRELVGMLDGYLKTFPEVPGQYVGWYYQPKRGGR